MKWKFTTFIRSRVSYMLCTHRPISSKNKVTGLLKNLHVLKIIIVIITSTVIE